MNTGITGIGWVTRDGFGSVATGHEQRFRDGEGVASLAKMGVFSHPFKNFGRLDSASRLTVSAIALALKDAGLEYSPAAKQPIGIVGCGQGSIESDLQYYRDFVDNGRTLSRANLFIYTLPSSQLGEAAIHFGLTGPLLFTAGTADSIFAPVSAAEEILQAGEVKGMLAGRVQDGEAIFLLLEKNVAPLYSAVEAGAAIDASTAVYDAVRRLSASGVKKGIV